jgi:hypothetical protein
MEKQNKVLTKKVNCIKRNMWAKGGLSNGKESLYCR